MTAEEICGRCGEPYPGIDDLFRCTCSRCGLCHELTADCECDHGDDDEEDRL